MQPGNHGSTFGGNPLACAAALATITSIENGGLMQRASHIGDRIMDGLRAELEGVEQVVAIRGKGCMIGVELNRPCKSLFAAAMAKGLIINVTADSVVRLLPPLIMSDSEADQVVAILAPLIKHFAAD